MQKSKLRFKFQTCLMVSVLFFAFAKPAAATTVFFDMSETTLKAGTLFELPIMINTESESVNALEGTIVFPSELLDVKEIRDGSSALTFWVERPHVSSSGKIVFSGVTPGGYNKERGGLFSIIFLAKKQGVGDIVIRDLRALRNDGLGSEAKVKVSLFQFSISSRNSTPTSLPPVLTDTTHPEDFTPAITRDSGIFNGQYFLVFATQDKGSGIDHYEVCEGNLDTCVVGESPFVLHNQTLTQTIFVKAVDRKGNVRVAILNAPNPWFKNYYLLGILILAGLLFLGVSRKILWRK